MKVIMIGGEPGTGKSTLMQYVSDKIKFDRFIETVKLVPYYQKDNIYLLGKYNKAEGYVQGTDKMSMACQPEVIKFLSTLPSDSVVLMEGDRLFTLTFLEHCESRYDLQIYILKAAPNIQSERFKVRGSEQNETWLSGRRTKIKNIECNLNLMSNITILHNNTTDDMINNGKRILENL